MLINLPKFETEVLLPMKRQPSEEALNIFFSLDDGFALPTGVSAFSIIKNNPDLPVRIHLCGINLSSSTINLFKKLQLPEFSEIVLHKFDPAWKIPGNRTTEHFPLANFIRLALVNLFPQYERILYVDGDTLCLGSLRPLQEVNLEGKLAAIVPDVAQTRAEKSKYIKDTESYFNAGVLLLNTKECIEANLCEKTFALLNSDKVLESPDQDALNIVMENKKVVLDKKFNFIQELKIGQNSDRERKNDAALIHYANRSKPWTQAYLTSLYASYLLASPWKDFPLELVYKKDPQSIKRFAFYKIKKGQIVEGTQLLSYFARVLIQRKINRIKTRILS